MARRPRRRARIARLFGIVVLAVVVVGVAGFLVYAQPQPILPEASAALASTADVEVSTAGRDLVFRPIGVAPTVGLILYPGGKVPPAAYAPTAHEIVAVSGALSSGGPPRSVLRNRSNGTVACASSAPTGPSRSR